MASSGENPKLTPAPAPPRDAAQSTDPLFAQVYAELHRLAAEQMAHEPAAHTLQPTALVHEVYLRLMQAGPGAWENRGHFFAAAAEAMRRVLVDWARTKHRQKRGGGLKRAAELPDLALAEPVAPEDLLALDEALQRLACHEPRKAQVVKLRYFAGLTSAAIAELLGVSVNTVDRDWTYARAWLYRCLTHEQEGPAEDPGGPEHE